MQNKGVERQDGAADGYCRSMRGSLVKRQLLVPNLHVQVVRNGHYWGGGAVVMRDNEPAEPIRFLYYWVGPGQPYGPAHFVVGEAPTEYSFGDKLYLLDAGASASPDSVDRLPVVTRKNNAVGCFVNSGLQTPKDTYQLSVGAAGRRLFPREFREEDVRHRPQLTLLKAQ